MLHVTLKLTNSISLFETIAQEVKMPVLPKNSYRYMGDISTYFSYEDTVTNIDIHMFSRYPFKA